MTPLPDMNRRTFLMMGGMSTIGIVTGDVCAQTPAPRIRRERDTTMRRPPESRQSITLFLCGDVMTGRGIDQALPHPSDPRLHEPAVRSALEYVALAEAANGPIARPLDFSYVWGDALAEFERMMPDVRIVNLETAVTTSDAHVEKGINYRMHPDNVPVLTAGGIDCVALANNHVLDWGHAGLTDTLRALENAGIETAGAGSDRTAATAPAALNVDDRGRVLVFAHGEPSSGIPRDWAATADRPGVALLDALTTESVRCIGEQVARVKRAGDVVVASLHWGGNWGYEVPPQHTAFARALIDDAAVDVVHGHSSHHPKGIEVYRDKPILYGCGDFVTDYEGITGHESYRADLGLMYFVRMDPARGTLLRLDMTPTRIERFRVNRASDDEARWLWEMLNREGRRFGTRVVRREQNVLTLEWGEGS